MSGSVTHWWQCWICDTGANVGSSITAEQRAEQHARVKHGGDRTTTGFGTTTRTTGGGR